MELDVETIKRCLGKELTLEKLGIGFSLFIVSASSRECVEKEWDDCGNLAGSSATARDGWLPMSGRVNKLLRRYSLQAENTSGGGLFIKTLVSFG